MKKFLIAVLLVAVMAVPAFASVQNVKVSGDLSTTWAVRDNFDLGAGVPNRHMNDVLSFARVRIDADLTDNVSTTVRLLNERPWGRSVDAANGDQVEEIDIDLAYVQLREMLYSPLTVTLGRQELFYGNGFIIGGNGPNNTTLGALNYAGAADLSMRKSLDAVKAVFNYDPLTIDLVAAVVNSEYLGGFKYATPTTLDNNNRTDDINLYGINANYKLSDKWNSVAEAYFFTKTDKSTAATSTRKTDAVYVPGVRLSTNPIKGLNLQGEFAWQSGTDYVTPTLSTKREAMAAQFIASYLLPFEKTAKYQPVVAYAYTYASGDKDLSAATGPGKRMKGWDPMFEHVSGGKIYNAIMDLTNCHVNEFSLSMKPVQDITTKFSWTMLSLDKKIVDSTWTTAFGTEYNVNTDKKALGNEFDLDLTYAYTEDVSIGLSAGMFLPGKVYDRPNQKTATQLLSSMSVAF